MKSKVRLYEEKIFESLKIVLEDDDPIWSTARQIILTGGWRSGKSTRGAARVLRQILRPTEYGLIWLLGPDYIQAREEYRYLLEWTQRLNLYEKHSFPNEGQCRLLTTTGWEIVTKSAKHPERLGSVAPDAVVLCEPGQMPEDAYVMALGRLMQKNGWLLACGTLEAGDGHPNWLWYEELANDWLRNPPTSDKVAFSLPSWKNLVWFPGGEYDPKIQEMRNTLSDYVFARRIAGLPIGVEHPCYPSMWDFDAKSTLCLSLHHEIEVNRIKFMDGAFGVDYGATDDHPSVIAIVQLDNMGRFWIVDIWSDKGGNINTIIAAAETRKREHGVYRGRVDPKQGWAAQQLGFNLASGSGPAPTEARIALCRALFDDHLLYFNKDNPTVELAWKSMKALRRTKDLRGRLVYDRMLGDDEAQAVVYALEELRGIPNSIPNMNALGTGVKLLRMPSERTYGRT